jgi:hypothetical protein
MASLKYNLQLAPGADAAFSQYAREQIVNEMRRRLLLNRSSILTKIMAYLKLTFWNTPVCKAMTGRDPSNDLAAEFGVTDHDMQMVAEHMAEVIGSSPMLIGPDQPFAFTPGTVMVCEVKAVSADWPKYELGKRTAYPSEPSGMWIKWMQWMLEDPAIDFITAQFDIVYRGESMFYDLRIEKKSRSGRAVMASLKQLEARGLAKGGYLFPDICRPKANQNFLEYTFSQPGVGEHILNVVKGYLA